MMRRSVVALALALAAATTVSAAPAHADAESAPSALCGDDNTVTVLYTHPSLGWTKPLTRRTATHGGCASAWATGQMTSAAITK